MNFTLRHTEKFGTFEVLNSNGNVVYRGPFAVAAAELSRLNREASVPVARTAAERKRDRQEAKERGNHGGFGVSRSK